MVRVSMEQFIADIDHFLEHVETSGDSVVVTNAEGTRFELRPIADEPSMVDTSSATEFQD